jgi:hypothetical protein
MAKEQAKMIGLAATLVGLTITIVGIAWASGSKVTAVEKDVEAVQENAKEDREAIGTIAVRTTALEVEASEQKVRDARLAGQYTEIIAYMRTNSEKTGEIQKSVESVRKTVSEQTIINAVNSEKLQSLTKD